MAQQLFHFMSARPISVVVLFFSALFYACFCFWKAIRAEEQSNREQGMLSRAWSRYHRGDK